MKRLAGLSALALIISSTSGCGWLWGEDGYFRDRGNDYLEARETAPMQVPAGLNAKRLDPLLPIPGAVSSARPASDVEFEVPRPPALSAAAAEASDFSLQKSGSARWIVAQRPPAEVWPVARQFFEENGFSIAEEQPQIGEFSTAWQSLDNVSATLARRLSSRVAFAENAGETRVRVRVEPGVQRNTSEVFILSVERPASIARPRQIAMYLAKELTQKSLPEIGELFGGRDHTTVLHAVRKIAGERQQLTELNQQLHVLEQTLKG